jgi:hypothetical protein
MTAPNQPETLIGPPPKAGGPVNVIDPKFFNEVSQFAHTGVAGLIYLSIGHIAQAHSFFRWAWYGVIIVVGIALAGFKEGYYDPRHENEATRGSGLEDFSFYVFGILIAVVVILV